MGAWERITRLREAGRLIVVLGCGKNKRTGVKAAIDLYTGSSFRRRLRLARLLTQNDDLIYILSAKYGLLHSQDRIATYDLRYLELSSEERVRWKEQVRAQLKERLPPGAKVIYLCGADYYQGLPGKYLLHNTGRLGWQNHLIARLTRRLRPSIWRM